MARHSMPQRNMRASGRIPILQDESCSARQGKAGERALHFGENRTHGTKAGRAKRKTCAGAELV
jgi:hypothetical protein